MDKREVCAKVEIPLQALERAGVVGVKERTYTLILAAAAINGMRDFDVELEIELPLTKTRMTIKSSVKVERFELTSGEIKMEVLHA